MIPQILCIFTGILGLTPVIIWYRRDKVISYIVLILTIFTVIQHSTERIGNYPSLLKSSQQISQLAVWLDRFSCLLLVTCIFIRRVQIHHKWFLSIALSLIIICDLGIVTEPWTFAIIHSIWHGMGWLYLSLLSHKEKDSFDIFTDYNVK